MGPDFGSHHSCMNSLSKVSCLFENCLLLFSCVAGLRKNFEQYLMVKKGLQLTMCRFWFHFLESMGMPEAAKKKFS